MRVGNTSDSVVRKLTPLLQEIKDSIYQKQDKDEEKLEQYYTNIENLMKDFKEEIIRDFKTHVTMNKNPYQMGSIKLPHEEKMNPSKRVLSPPPTSASTTSDSTTKKRLPPSPNLPRQKNLSSQSVPFDWATFEGGRRGKKTKRKRRLYKKRKTNRRR
tara:strand:- start:5439 stop:5912 length:474 start_codon:yes stop_codon:yes gene_type:complete